MFYYHLLSSTNVFRIIVCPTSYSVYEVQLRKLGYEFMSSYWSGNLHDHTDKLRWTGNNSDSLDDILNIIFPRDNSFQKDFVVWEQPWVQIVPLEFLFPYLLCYEIQNYTTSNIIYMGSHLSYVTYLVDPRHIFDLDIYMK